MTVSELSTLGRRVGRSPRRRGFSGEPLDNPTQRLSSQQYPYLKPAVTILSGEEEAPPGAGDPGVPARRCGRS